MVSTAKPEGAGRGGCYQKWIHRAVRKGLFDRSCDPQLRDPGLAAPQDRSRGNSAPSLALLPPPYLLPMQSSPLAESAQELEGMRPMWESLLVSLPSRGQRAG